MKTEFYFIRPFILTFIILMSLVKAGIQNLLATITEETNKTTVN